MLQQIQATVASADVLVAALPLRQLFALCTRAHSMISVDTGPAHAAAALDLPLVVLFGAEPQRLWLPRGPSSSPVLGVGGPPDSVRVDQIPVEAVFSDVVRTPAKSGVAIPLSLRRPVGRRHAISCILRTSILAASLCLTAAGC